MSRRFPLREYSLMLGIFNLLLGWAVFRGREQRIDGQSLLLWGVGTHKLSRILTKDVVTRPLRAPFTRFQDFLGYGEVAETPRGKSVRYAIGEMLSCNYCADPWVAMVLLYGLQQAPGKTRFFLKFLSAVALADFLHVAYEKNRTSANVLTLREEKLERQERESA